MVSGPLERTTNSPEETRAVGQRLGELADPGDLILLTGDLGAGKTCLAQGIAAGLGFGGRAASPSFVLVREYRGRLDMYHIDLYRLADPAEIASLGIDDYIEGEGVCVVEWAERARSFLPADHLLIEMAHLAAPNERRLRFEPCGERYVRLLEGLETGWSWP